MPIDDFDLHKKEILWQAHDAWKAVSGIKAAESGDQLRKEWENLVQSFGRTVERLVTISKLRPATKSWGYRLYNLTDGHDEGLSYLREARNVAQHGIEPFAHFSDPVVDIGGVIGCADVKNATIVGNMVSKGSQVYPIGDFNFDAEGGKIKRLIGQPLVPIIEKPAEVKLVPVTNPQNGKYRIVPSTILGRPLMPGSPLSLAEEAGRCLRQLIKEWDDLCD